MRRISPFRYLPVWPSRIRIRISCHALSAHHCGFHMIFLLGDLIDSQLNFPYVTMCLLGGFSIYEFKHCFTYTFNHFSDNIVKHQCYPWGTFSNQWDGRKPPMWTRRRAFPRLSLPNPKSAPQYQVCGPLPALACQPPWKEVCLTHVVGKCKSETFQQCTTFQLCPTTSPFLSKMMYQRCLAWHVNTVFGLNWVISVGNLHGVQHTRINI